MTSNTLPSCPEEESTVGSSRWQNLPHRESTRICILFLSVYDSVFWSVRNKMQILEDCFGCSTRGLVWYFTHSGLQLCILHRVFYCLVSLTCGLIWLFTHSGTSSLSLGFVFGTSSPHFQKDHQSIVITTRGTLLPQEANGALRRDPPDLAQMR